MVTFSCVLEKFKDKGEKSGWTYITIPTTQAEKLKPGVKTSFRVKGKIDSHSIKQVALLPMGNGSFIIPINATMRKALQKAIGNKVNVSLSVDTSDFKISTDFLACLEEEAAALQHFEKLSPSHQRYFSKWIESAKTETTKVKRITQSIQGLAMGLDYSAMVRYFQNKL